MFCESLTPEQLVHFAQMVGFLGFLGGLLGANMGGLFECLFKLIGWSYRRFAGSEKTRLDTIRDAQRERYYLLLRARTLKRELRKLSAAND